MCSPVAVASRLERDPRIFPSTRSSGSRRVSLARFLSFALRVSLGSAGGTSTTKGSRGGKAGGARERRVYFRPRFRDGDKCSFRREEKDEARRSGRTESLRSFRSSGRPKSGLSLRREASLPPVGRYPPRVVRVAETRRELSRVLSPSPRGPQYFGRTANAPGYASSDSRTGTTLHVTLTRGKHGQTRNRNGIFGIVGFQSFDPEVRLNRRELRLEFLDVRSSRARRPTDVPARGGSLFDRCCHKRQSCSHYRYCDDYCVTRRAPKDRKRQ